MIWSLSGFGFDNFFPGKIWLWGLPSQFWREVRILKDLGFEMCNASNDMFWMRDMETDKTSRKLTQNSTKSHGKGHAGNNIERQEKIYLDQREN